MPTYSYYPGCSLHGMSSEYDRLLRLIAPRLGIALREVPDWTCCGSTAAHTIHETAALALPARNLAQAGPAGLPVLAPCAMCYSRLKITQHELQQTSTRRAIASLLGQPSDPFPGQQLAVLSLLGAFTTEEARSALTAAVVKPLKGLKVVCYYGCLLVRPAEIMHPDSVENPQTMDHLMQQLGAEVLDWPFKTECCGGSLALARLEIVLALGRKLLAMARSRGADCIVTACPMCQNNLDARQSQIKARYGHDFDLPIVYVTELMGLAFGLSPQALGLDKHLVDGTRLAAQVAATDVKV